MIMVWWMGSDDDDDERTMRYEYVMLIMKWLWNDIEMRIWCDDEWVVSMMMIKSMWSCACAWK
jgi:hypothetical protein